MKIRVYFCKESDPEIILKGDKISRQALDTIYDLVWECEFKNILNAGSLDKIQRRRSAIWNIFKRKKESSKNNTMGPYSSCRRGVYDK